MGLISLLGIYYTYEKEVVTIVASCSTFRLLTWLL